MNSLFHRVGLWILLFSAVSARAVVFTSDATISFTNTSYDGADLVVSNCTLTLEGEHGFNSVQLLSAAILTHTFSPSGFLTNNFAVTNEAHVLVDTNYESLDVSNAVVSSIAVTDDSGLVTYSNVLDYVVDPGSNGFRRLQRTAFSAIPDGASVLVSYSVTNPLIPARVKLTVTNDLIIETGSRVDVTGRGGATTTASSSGSPLSGGGGGHGGRGGNSSSNAMGGTTYGVVTEPQIRGTAGGAGVGGPGGVGGGVVNLSVNGRLQIDGSIVANGANATNSRAGGGSGGSIWITAQTVAGNGSVTAHGGAGEPIHGGGGGGGRIAFYFQTNLFTGTLSAFGGNGFVPGGAGTVYKRWVTLLSGLVIVDNGGVAGAETELQSDEFIDLIVTNRARLRLPTVSDLRHLAVSSNSWIVGSELSTLLTVNGNATIDAGGGFEADGRGFSAGQGFGPGTSTSSGSLPLCSGGGHGGKGGSAGAPASGGGGLGDPFAPGGNAYGSFTFPGAPGSGGGGGGSLRGGSGGGVVRLTVGGELVLNGTISVNGNPGTNSSAGGGSGGSVWLTLGQFSGSGTIRANGGNAVEFGGGGGGGRIAVYYGNSSFSGGISAIGGSGLMHGGAGTIYLQANTNTFGALIFDNGNATASNSAHSSLSGSSVSADLTIRNGAVLPLAFSPITIGNLLISSNAALIATNELLSLSISGDAILDAGCSINADFRYGGQFNSPSGAGAGGSHAGYGGSPSGFGAPAGHYGSAFAPMLPGSIGSGSGGGRGGGAVHLSVGGACVINGLITANGSNAFQGSSQTFNPVGGGAGGSIRITAQTFAGNGLLSVNGGAATNNGGGGSAGRIAIEAPTNLFTGSYSLIGGAGYNRGAAGTLYLSSGKQLIIDHGGIPGATNTSWSGSVANLNLIVRNGGVAELPSEILYDNVVVEPTGSINLNRRRLTASSLIVHAGGVVHADKLGWDPSQGPGAGSAFGTTGAARTGGGHGGRGGAPVGSGGGATYGSIHEPTTVDDLGSGGGNGSGSSGLAPYGGRGGGIAYIQAATVTIDGRVSANGGIAESFNSGGGSGGAVALFAGTLAGSGTISANGGARGIGGTSTNEGGGGGGGRILIRYSTNLFTGNITAQGGAGGIAGGAGTIHIKHSSQEFGDVFIDNSGQAGALTPILPFNAQHDTLKLIVRNGANVSPTSVDLANLVIASNGTVSASGPFLRLTVTNSLVIANGGVLAADGFGHNANAGAGAGQFSGGSGGGGGHGGAGGVALSGAAGGATNGSMFYPTNGGSGGGYGPGAPPTTRQGGGAIELSIGGSLTIDGIIRANGNDAPYDNTGGAAGGSIWITTPGTFSGNGLLSAKGGAGESAGGGGGGGRIALYFRTNAFAGTFSVAGGPGSNPGGPGTVYLSTNLPLEVIAQVPAGLVMDAVTNVHLTFNGEVKNSIVPKSSVVIQTPNGPLASSNFNITALNPSQFLISFPTQTAVGSYAIEVGPAVFNLLNQPMSQTYTGTFEILLPVIQGTVTDTNGTPLPGVRLNPDNGLSFTTSGVDGAYALGFTPGSSFTVTPTNGAWIFVPGLRSYTNVAASISNQNFIAVTSLAATLQGTVQGADLVLNWHGIPGASYQAFCSTNLIDWIPWGGGVIGSNNTLELTIPIGEEPSKFFRVNTSN